MAAAEESKRALAVGAVVLAEDGRVLLVRRGRPPKEGEWSLPGGRVEEGESLEKAIVREVFEETGLRVEVRRPLGIVSLDREGFSYDIHEFACSIVEPQTPVAGDDALDVRWATEDELTSLGVGSLVAKVVRRAKRGSGQR